jgi:hypothetical protein
MISFECFSLKKCTRRKDWGDAGRVTWGRANRPHIFTQSECFDADTGKDSAREIREYYVPDFTNWKHHDAYQTEFEKLLRDLKTERAP